MKLKVRYPESRLSLYDGSKSIHGIARAIQISTHGFINNDVIHHATALRGANLYMLPARQGSFLQEIVIEITQNPAVYAAGVGSGVLTNALYDFLKITLKKATGLLAEPETPFVTRLNTEDEPFLDSVAEAMEGSLIDAHRTIQQGGGNVTIERPRSTLSSLDRDTFDWVTTREQRPDIEEIEGHITRYNVISQKGRLYDKYLQRTLSFGPENNHLSDGDAAIVSWSLDQATNRLPANIIMRVRRVLSARDESKRYILVGCRHIS